jgi:hypothetical protein
LPKNGLLSQLSQAIQFLSEPTELGATLIGFCQVTPSVERLTTTAGVSEVFEMGSDAMIHTPCFAS